MKLLQNKNGIKTEAEAVISVWRAPLKRNIHPPHIQVSSPCWIWALNKQQRMTAHPSGSCLRLFYAAQTHFPLQLLQARGPVQYKLALKSPGAGQDDTRWPWPKTMQGDPQPCHRGGPSYHHHGAAPWPHSRPSWFSTGWQQSLPNNRLQIPKSEAGPDAEAGFPQAEGGVGFCVFINHQLLVKNQKWRMQP